MEPHRAISYRRAAAAGDIRRAREILDEHDGIVTAFEQGDREQALRMLAHHREHGLGDFHRLLEQVGRETGPASSSPDV